MFQLVSFQFDVLRPSPTRCTTVPKTHFSCYKANLIKVNNLSDKKKKKKERKGKLRNVAGIVGRLRQLLGFLVERVHHLSHVRDGLQGGVVSLVHRRLLEDDQNAIALVQDSAELLV